ncbi:MAG: hypothetical protein ACRCXL_07600 [Dermatophilaceae bacterium]
MLLPSVVLLYLAFVALLSGAAALGARCSRAADAGAVVAEILLVVHAVADVADVVRGPQPPDVATHLGYVAVSVVLLPLLLAQVASPRGRLIGNARARHAVAGLTCAALVVVVVRQSATGAG